MGLFLDTEHDLVGRGAFLFEGKQGDMEHSTVLHIILSTQDVVQQRESAVAHVGQRSGLPSQPRPVLWVRVLAAAQLLREHLALRWPPCGGVATGGDRAAANVSVLVPMKANPRVQAAVEVGLASEGQAAPSPRGPSTHRCSGVQAAGAHGRGHEDGVSVRVQRVADDVDATQVRGAYHVPAPLHGWMWIPWLGIRDGRVRPRQGQQGGEQVEIEVDRRYGVQLLTDGHGGAQVKVPVTVRKAGPTVRAAVSVS